MPRDYIFVSCDIISHSAEPSLLKQTENIAAINKMVREALLRTPARDVIWASGGDGGHVAFPADGMLKLALELLIAFRRWSLRSGVSLRVTGNHGSADSLDGADGRTQLVGPGINLAGKLLPFGAQSRIIVTEGFVRLAGTELMTAVSIHDERRLQLADLPDEKVYLVSLDREFSSGWDTPIAPTDRKLLQMAWEGGHPLEVIYRAKRLFEIDSEEVTATNMLHMLALRRIRPRGNYSFIFDLLLEEQFGVEIISASTLVERQRGETICEFGDHGTTMFLIIRGQVGVFFPKPLEPAGLQSPPPDLIMFPGELAGELAFALRRPRTATLRCLEDSAFLAFSSTELFEKIRRAKSGAQLEQALNRKLLSRIIENLWNTAGCFRGGASPEALADLSAPWVTLLDYTHIVTIGKKSRVTDFEVFEPDFEGLALLVSGSYRIEENGRVLDGKSYPVITANFPGEFTYRKGRCLLQDDVKLLKISREGLLELGVESYTAIIERTRNSVLDQMSCFISYSSKDEEFARQLHRRMCDAHLRVWFAPEDIQGGQKLHEQIETAIRAHDKLLIVLSEASLQSEWVMTELRKAFKAEQQSGKRKLFPVRLVDYDTLRAWECPDSSSGKDLAEELRQYFIPDFSHWKEHDPFETAFARLLKDLRAEERAK